MKRAFVLSLLLAASFAEAQKKKNEDPDDAPIPYSDEEDEDARTLPGRSRATPNIRDETDVEQQDREESLADYDDPNYGFAGEFVSGVMLLESSRGGGVEPRFNWGLRFCWEWSRTLGREELFRELFFADLQWFYTGMRDGTREVVGDSHYHYFTIAPAISYPLGALPVSVYGQVGIGFNVQTSGITLNTVPTFVTGTKLLFQYGGGLRFRPTVIEFQDGHSMRLSMRIEVMRFRRGYMDDTFIGASLGAVF